MKIKYYQTMYDELELKKKAKTKCLKATRAKKACVCGTRTN